MTRVRSNLFARAFTLVEILIVVVILGILASIVVPQFATATSDTQRTAIADQVRKLRQAIAVYYVRNGNVYPNITAGDGLAGAWGEIGPGTAYMRTAPVNAWVGGTAGRLIVTGTAPDSSYLATRGWIWDATTGNLWAAGCDGADEPLPRP